MGMRRYNSRSKRQQWRATSVVLQVTSLLNQLPELYAGFQLRDPTGPQCSISAPSIPPAWAAGAPFMLLQAMLGLQQDAPRGKLYVDPMLPDWLPDVTLTDLRLGGDASIFASLAKQQDTLFEVTKRRESTAWSSE